MHMTIELSVLINAVIVLIGVGAAWGIMRQTVKNLQEGRVNHDARQEKREENDQTWRNGEATRFDIARHQMIEPCRQEFKEIADALKTLSDGQSYLKGQIDMLVGRKTSD